MGRRFADLSPNIDYQVRSNKAVFVRAPYMDYMKHTPYTTTIHKVQQCDGEITVSCRRGMDDKRYWELF